MYNLQLRRHGRWFRKFAVRFPPIRKELESSMYNNKNNIHCKIKETLLIRDLKLALNAGSEKLLLYQPFIFFSSRFNLVRLFPFTLHCYFLPYSVVLVKFNCSFGHPLFFLRPRFSRFQNKTKTTKSWRQWQIWLVYQLSLVCHGLEIHMYVVTDFLIKTSTAAKFQEIVALIWNTGNVLCWQCCV